MRAPSIRRAGDEPARPAEQQHLARRAPATRRTARGARPSPALDPATGERRVELHEREVADDAVVVATEPLDRDRRRPTTARPCARGGDAAATSRSDARAATRSRSSPRGGGAPSHGAARARADAARRARAGEARPASRPRSPHARAIARSSARAPSGLDELSAQRADDGVRHRRDGGGAGSRRAPGGRADQRVAREARVEPLGVVVHASMNRARSPALLVRRADDDAPVRPLPGGRDATAAARRARSHSGP